MNEKNKAKLYAVYKNSLQLSKVQEEKIYNENIVHKVIEMAKLVSDKIDFRKNVFLRQKGTL